ncbi:Os03g0119400, partial [Oryza sativa Japonica Group]
LSQLVSPIYQPLPLFSFPSLVAAARQAPNAGWRTPKLGEVAAAVFRLRPRRNSDAQSTTASARWAR